MRLTTRTNLAMRVLMVCAVNSGRLVRKFEIAQSCNASENHLAQVINLLSTHGFIHTIRGRAGGLKLARSPEEISVGDVMRAFERGLPVTECFSPETNTCPLIEACLFRDALREALNAFYRVLDGYTLASLTQDNVPLAQILQLCAPRMTSACGARG
ncbi:Rrf2 family transcriptional regulator [Thioclava sp. BHET1]|uniref:Rrf2 family transcriptional regulator n=1 Tax=Thioclava dalianensis TaxID=1185766 RepID=A0A074UAB1_9RHOB|nr:Rrf2 family transcriptional regulator [Thioclava dalianensis]KEP71637.1 Rrf2 family transcriptional regulator [Thioclava dalianensis]TMV90151.1 Rrf2 family transcriptional regulator [Thioclava sp. BHET1]SFN42431.1 transcriptional regulator, BadM/Rrf2 family [Thioclava dalianensis]